MLIFVACQVQRVIVQNAHQFNAIESIEKQKVWENWEKTLQDIKKHEADNKDIKGVIIVRDFN